MHALAKRTAQGDNLVLLRFTRVKEEDLGAEDVDHVVGWAVSINERRVHFAFFTSIEVGAVPVEVGIVTSGGKTAHFRLRDVPRPCRKATLAGLR